jgi:hypothetical protein
MRTVLGMTVLLGVLTCLSASALAHISPPGCTANDVNINLTRTPSVLVSGGTVTYTGTLTNGGAGACDATILGDVVLHCPAANGTPTGQTFVVIPAVPGGRLLPADGTGDQAFGPTNCVISGPPGFYTAEVSGNGILHDADVDISIETIQKTVTVALVECLTVTDCSAVPHDAQCQTLACTAFQCVVNNVGDGNACTDTDGTACTQAACEAGACNQAHQTTVCTPDNNECTNDLACNPQTGLCEHPPVGDGTPCTDSDNNACTTPACVAGSCNQANHTTVCTPDSNECTQDLACNTTTGLCEHPPVGDGTPCIDTDNLACTQAACEAGICNQSHTSDCAAICRTPGFWKTRGCGTDGLACEKDTSANLAAAALALAGGSITVCGEVLTNTVVPDNSSVLEALCVAPAGNITLQLARQLTAMALNCAVSGFNGDCSGVADIAALFANCNTVCTGGSVPGFSVDSCIGAVDAFNNGTSDLAFGCHSASDEDLAGALGVSKLGPAGSPKACNEATGNSCTIFSASSASCP